MPWQSSGDGPGCYQVRVLGVSAEVVGVAVGWFGTQAMEGGGCASTGVLPLVAQGRHGRGGRRVSCGGRERAAKKRWWKMVMVMMDEVVWRLDGEGRRRLD